MGGGGEGRRAFGAPLEVAGLGDEVVRGKQRCDAGQGLERGDVVVAAEVVRGDGEVLDEGRVVLPLMRQA